MSEASIIIICSLSWFLGVCLGYLIGWSRGNRDWRKTYIDQLFYGIGITKDGKRVDPKKFFK